jgi:uroporphyrin-III C-methyltransferase
VRTTPGDFSCSFVSLEEIYSPGIFKLHTMPPALLTAVDSSEHVHLIIGSNPLAGARCTRSLEVGAVAKFIAPAEAVVHYGLKKRAEEGQVHWIKREFQDEDLTTLGRADVDHVVDAVFVTLGRTHPQSINFSQLFSTVH